MSSTTMHETSERSAHATPAHTQSVSHLQPFLTALVLLTVTGLLSIMISGGIP